MNILQKIGQWFIRQGGGFEAFVGWGGSAGGYGGTRAWKYGQYVKEGYRENPVVNGCITQIQQACVRVNLVLTKDGEKLEKPLKGIEPLIALLKRPNPTQSISEFIEMWVMHMYLGGISYIHGIGLGKESYGNFERTKGSPELWLIRPDRVKILHSKVEGITGYAVTNEQGGTDTFSPDEILHLKFPDALSNYEGAPPLQSIERVIDAHSNSIRWNDSLLKKNARISGIVTIKGISSLSPKDEAEFQKQVDEYQGAKNAGAVMITTAEGSDFTPLSHSALEIDWLNGQREMMRIICATLGVPSKLLNDPEAGTYANYKEARKALYTDTALPRMTQLIGELNHWLVPKYDPSLLIVSDTSHIDVLRADENERAQRLAVASWKTINDKRKEDGLKDVEGGDVLLMPLNQVPLGSTGMFSSLPYERRFADTTPLDHIDPRSLYLSEEERAARLMRVDRKKLTWEQTYRRQLKRYFEVQRDKVLKALDLTGTVDGVFSLNGIETRAAGDEVKRFVEEFEEVQLGIVMDFGQAAIDELGEAALFDIERPALQQWLATDLENRSKLINKTTATKIKKVLDKAVSEGLGAPERAKLIKAVYKESAEKGRALAISRTEVGRAANTATLEGYKQTGVNFKEWLSARDNDVRDEHVFMDGQVVGIDEDFPMPGGGSTPAPLMSGVAGFDINCRCLISPLKSPEDVI